MNRTDVLQAANEAVSRRNESYGQPEDNFSTIAELWSVYLRHEVQPFDVAMMMALLKIARARNDEYNEDNLVDLAGYAACAAECV